MISFCKFDEFDILYLISGYWISDSEYLITHDDIYYLILIVVHFDTQWV